MEALKNLRKQKGITMKQLGLIIGVSESTISLYESGKRQPDYETLKHFADYFNTSVDYLLGREEKNTNSIIYIKETSLIKKIKKLNQIDLIKAEAYVDGLLESNDYSDEMRIAAENSHDTGTKVIDNTIELT